VPETTHLRRLQEQLRAAIADPGPAGLDPEGVIRSSTKLSASQRLDLYRRSHRERLLEAMRAFYPALAHMLGRELFDDLAWEYLQERPSRSYTLQRLGEGLPDYLETNRPDADGPRETWPDLMIDLARLERAFAEVYDAPGLEGEATPSSADLPAAPDASWLAATVEPAPCLRLLRSSFAAGPYLAAVRRGEQPAIPVPAESFLAISRRDYAVRLTPLDAARHQLLDRLRRGAPIKQAAAAAELSPLAAWQEVRRWSEDACFRSLRRGDPAARSSSDQKTPEKEYA
jgi:hypothetical protein